MYHDGGPDGVRPVGDAIIFHLLLCRVLAVGDATELGAHQALRICDELLRGAQHPLGAVALQQLQGPALADVQRTEHGVKVAPGVAGSAVVGEDDLPHLPDVLAGAHELDRGQPQPFLEHLRGIAGKRADHLGADLCQVDRSRRRTSPVARRRRPASASDAPACDTRPGTGRCAPPRRRARSCRGPALRSSTAPHAAWRRAEPGRTHPERSSHPAHRRRRTRGPSTR